MLIKEKENDRLVMNVNADKNHDSPDDSNAKQLDKVS